MKSPGLSYERMRAAAFTYAIVFALLALGLFATPAKAQIVYHSRHWTVAVPLYGGAQPQYYNGQPMSYPYGYANAPCPPQYAMVQRQPVQVCRWWIDAYGRYYQYCWFQ